MAHRRVDDKITATVWTDSIVTGEVHAKTRIKNGKTQYGYDVSRKVNASAEFDKLTIAEKKAFGLDGYIVYLQTVYRDTWMSAKGLKVTKVNAKELLHSNGILTKEQYIKSLANNGIAA